MRRTQWAVFTSMNPRNSPWRSLYQAAEPRDAAVPDRDQRSAADDERGVGDDHDSDSVSFE